MMRLLGDALLSSQRSLSTRYVIEFVESYRSFRLPELKAVAEVLGIQWTLHESAYDDETLHIVADYDGPASMLAALAERAMLVRYVAVLWGHGKDWPSCLQSIDPDAVAPYKTASFKFNFLSRSKKITLDRRKHLFEIMDPLNFTGEVQMKTPEYTHLCVEDYGPDGINPPEEPVQVLLATLVAESKRGELIRRFDLKKRNMIGNTSMDPELSLIMANMAKARPGSFIIDPFCGTASLLLPCAYFGSHVCGSDIAFQVVHGIGKTSRTGTGSKIRGPKENVWSNFEQYGLTNKFVDVLVADNSIPCWDDREMFDAIVADPPYGIREPARKIASEEQRIPDEYRDGKHFPKSEAYNLGSVFHDLLQFAAQRLVHGGMLCYWIPEILDDDSFQIPTHPCLELVSACQQPLSLRLARRLVSMRKVRSLQEGDRTVETLPSTWSVRPAIFAESRAPRSRSQATQEQQEHHESS
eukprot:m.73826 g.73826  ORF g.73826 m.73826 type:complete len:469 (+) comp13916_c0_seq2:73-1479(+)